MAELDALGQARRARGVELVAGVPNVAGDLGICGGLAGDPVDIADLVGRCGIAEHHDPLHGIQLHLGEMRQEVGANQQHPRLGVVDDVLHLRRSQTPIHGQRDGVAHGRTEEHGEVLAGVLVENGHPVLRSHALGTQGVSHLR